MAVSDLQSIEDDKYKEFQYGITTIFHEKVHLERRMVNFVLEDPRNPWRSWHLSWALRIWTKGDIL